MNEAEQRLLVEQATYIGPVVGASRALLASMRPMPLCVVCPAAQWYRVEDDKGDKRLEAFCTEFHGVMYDYRRRAVTACDARTDTIAGDSTPGTRG